MAMLSIIRRWHFRDQVSLAGRRSYEPELVPCSNELRLDRYLDLGRDHEITQLCRATSDSSVEGDCNIG
jgi:hypothetical protein